MSSNPIVSLSPPSAFLKKECVIARLCFSPQFRFLDTEYSYVDASTTNMGVLCSGEYSLTLPCYSCLQSG